LHCQAIFKKPFIERPTYYFTYLRVHSVLYFQEIDWVVRLHQPLEQALIVMMLKANGTEDCSWELLWISNQYKSLAAVKQRDEARNLYCLTSLVDYDGVELYICILK
jgi:hypothetical protein